MSEAPPQIIVYSDWHDTQTMALEGRKPLNTDDVLTPRMEDDMVRLVKSKPAIEARDPFVARVSRVYYQPSFVERVGYFGDVVESSLARRLRRYTYDSIPRRWYDSYYRRVAEGYEPDEKENKGLRLVAEIPGVRVKILTSAIPMGKEIMAEQVRKANLSGYVDEIICRPDPWMNRALYKAAVLAADPASYGKQILFENEINLAIAAARFCRDVYVKLGREDTIARLIQLGLDPDEIPGNVHLESTTYDIYTSLVRN